MNLILILLFTIIPVFIIMKIIYDLDKIEKEPIKMLIFLFIGGIISWVIVRLTSKLINGHVYELSAGSPFLKNDWEFFLISFGLIAVVEELSKFLVLNTICWRSKNFDYPYDAVVYGVFVSLGFAFAENIMYLYQQGLGIAVSRAIFSIPAHAIFGVLMGYYLGLAKVCQKKDLKSDCTKLRYFAFFIPLIYHGIYDYICNFNAKYIYYFFVAYVIIMYIIAILKIKKLNNLEYNIEYTDEEPELIPIGEEEVYSNQVLEESENKIKEQLFNNEVSPDKHIHMKMFSNDDDFDNGETNTNV